MWGSPEESSVPGHPLRGQKEGQCSRLLRQHGRTEAQRGHTSAKMQHGRDRQGLEYGLSEGQGPAAPPGSAKEPRVT